MVCVTSSFDYVTPNLGWCVWLQVEGYLECSSVVPIELVVNVDHPGESTAYYYGLAVWATHSWHAVLIQRILW